MTTLLVVDDNEREARAVARYVEKWLDVVIACSYEDALDELSKRRDVRGVFADVRLGDAHPHGGLAVLEAARARDAHCVLTACSGHDTKAIRAHAARLRAVFVAKPLGIQPLRAMVEEVKRRSEVRPFSSPPPESGAISELRHREALRVAAALSLTESERAVLVVLTMFRGKTHGELAASLGVSIDTFNTHGRHIAKKAGQRLSAVLAGIDEAVLARAATPADGARAPQAIET